MSNTNSSNELLPNLMGTEHELSVTFNPRKKINLSLEPDFFEEDKKIDPVYTDDFYSTMYYDSISEYVLADFDSCSPNAKALHNGGVISFIPDRPLEIATPECNDPKQLLTYSIAARLILKETLRDYLTENSEDIKSISFNERVIDSSGNTWGEHDNFSLLESESGYGVIESVTPKLILLHLLTRGVVSGAGVVYGSGNRCWSLSQKLPTVSVIHDKKWGSTAMWGDDDRLEIRCSDKNVSEWSHLMRLGTMALILALTRSGENIESLGLSSEKIDLENVGEFDGLHVNKRGHVKLSYDAKVAASIQRVLAESSLDLLDKYGVKSSIYNQIANNWLNFANKLEKATQLEEPLDLSQFIEADWAAKFFHIQNRMKKDIDNGLPREPFDYVARAHDIMYDRVLLEVPISGGKIYESDGIGFKFNKRFSTRKIITEKDVQFASINAPLNSRAESRVKFINFLIENGCLVSSFDWSCISWCDETGDYHERHFNL